MRFAEYFLGLDEAQRTAYAERAGTTTEYIRAQLVRAKKVPRRDLFDALIQASEGRVTREELLDHFYPPRPLAAREVSA